jgi:hypothetical protein
MTIRAEYSKLISDTLSFSTFGRVYVLLFLAMKK